MGEVAWFTTAYFVDPLLICNGGRSSSDWDYYGTGDRLLVQIGTPENLISIPLTQAEADMSSDWLTITVSWAWVITTFSLTTPQTRLATPSSHSRSSMTR